MTDKRLTILIDPAIHHKLKQKALDCNVTITHMLTKVIEGFIKEKDNGKTIKRR